MISTSPASSSTTPASSTPKRRLSRLRTVAASSALALAGVLATTTPAHATLVGGLVGGQVPPKPTPTPKPAPKPAVSAYAPGTSVSYQQTQQVMVADRTSGSRGTWARYEWRGTSRGWVRVGTSAYAVFGRSGVVAASRRVQSTNTTPAGTFPILSAFGVGNPGTKLRYQKVTASSWWDERQNSRTYNRWIDGAHGCDRVNCEHLADYTSSLYRQAAVIGFNYNAPQVRTRTGGSGAGIFLHFAQHYTAGCVGISTHTELDATIRWMDPAKHPTIVIKA